MWLNSCNPPVESGAGPGAPPPAGSGIIGLMAHDCLGNAVTAAEGDTLRAVNDFIEGFLAYETRAEGIVRAAAQDPACCIANVYAGFLWMFLEAPDAPARAAPYIAAAEAAARNVTGRERSSLEVLKAWAAGDVPAAVLLCDAITDESPRDLVILKLGQYFEFNRGNFPALLRAALKVLDHNADIAYMHGMAAFGYEQCHLLDEAEDSARTALAHKRKEPWAQHALAHVLLTRGRIDEGVEFLESVEDTWDGLNSFMSTHLWWHMGLFLLSQGHVARVLEVYDRHCWGVAKDYSQDQIGAVSLLARMEIAGIDVGGRWNDLAHHLAARADDTVLPFLTLQYLHGLVRADRPEAALLIAAIRRTAREAPEGEVWRDVALPAAEGLYAYGRKDYATAWRRLMQALPRVIEAGGSHAQRDLFDQILLDAAIKSRRYVAAQQMLESRRSLDPDGVPVNVALSRVYRELGLAGLAEKARARAAATRARHHLGSAAS
jgi:tetratricopeptide (TPR) repeat protein